MVSVRSSNRAKVAGRCATYWTNETKNMYKLSLSLKEDIKPIIGFNKSEKEIINNSINSMIRNKKLEWAFIFLDKNFSILFSETDQLFNKLSLAKVNTWEELESATLEINRNLLNYLATQNTYLDHTEKYLKNIFGEDSTKFKEYKKLQGSFFDNNFSYRFFYNLRNYSVHYGYSICGIKIQKNEDTINYIPIFLLNDLLLYKNWHSAIKNDLKHLKDDFSAFNLIKDSFQCFAELNKYISNILLESNNQNKENVLNLLNIEKEKINNYCFLLDYGNEIKTSEIPTHYLI